MLFRITKIALLIHCCLPAIGQIASNNNIENRISLTINGDTLASSTNQSNVQWDCINKNLTQKCLVYHNDQWFSFIPDSKGPVYLHIGNQQCKNQKGVQVVILEGDPCQTVSYELKKCIGFTDQADFFITLDSLQSGAEYFINVDGFLGDLCSFEICLRSQPAGLPLLSPMLEDTYSRLSLVDSVVDLSWKLTREQLAGSKNFIVYRKKAEHNKSLALGTPVIANAFGSTKSEYLLTDTLKESGVYFYSIFVVQDKGVFLIGRHTISFRPMMTPKLISTRRYLDYYLSAKENVRVKVLNEDRRVLSTFTHRSEAGKNTITIDFKPFLEHGFRKFIVALKSKHIDEGRAISFD
jgi:hypothetical protein